MTVYMITNIGQYIYLYIYIYIMIVVTHETWSKRKNNERSYEVHTISFQTFFVWALSLIAHT